MRLRDKLLRPSEGPDSFELVGMRHRACGRFALFINADVIDDPTRKIMARDCFLPSGAEPPVGVPSTCPYCGLRYSLTPKDLDVDRGPDWRTSWAQKITLLFTTLILGGKAA